MIFVLFVAAAMAGLTWLVGWWGVLLAAAIIGVVFREEAGGGWRVAMAGAAAWAALLLLDAMRGSLGLLMHRLAGVTRAPAIVLVAVTLALPAALAWSAATVAALTARRVTRSSDATRVARGTLSSG